MKCNYFKQQIMYFYLVKSSWHDICVANVLMFIIHEMTVQMNLFSRYQQVSLNAKRKNKKIEKKKKKKKQGDTP